ncbi:hypothetical protein JYB87_00415 [Shewanella avicenniae]|uniref:Uncharacterized protein n=1 Tax=Shewanella avicenniae TaxID=2814294 RepID=A0ABX7QR62_9GAMM|nr:hypothetical protein [Shewanella avicenniae]QSX33754.1 hypothetical protein JYB87_00415 [Shewanella avicenniae]
MVKIIKKNRMPPQTEAIADNILVSTPEVKAFQDPDFHLLASFDKNDRHTILKFRTKNNVTIKEAIALFKARQIELESLKEFRQAALNKPKKKKKRSKIIKSHGGIMSSLVAVISVRDWGKTK